MVYVHSFRTTIHSSDGCFQQKKAPCNKHKSNWLLEHVSALSLDLNLIEHPLEYGGAGESHQGYAAKNVPGLIQKKSRKRPVLYCY